MLGKQGLIFAPEIGSNGSLADGNFRVLRVWYDGLSDTADARIIDSDNDMTEEVCADAEAGGEFGIRWGDTGDDISGHVQIDQVYWEAVSPDPVTEVIFSERPSDVVAGHAVLRFFLAL